MSAKIKLAKNDPFLTGLKVDKQEIYQDDQQPFE